MSDDNLEENNGSFTEYRRLILGDIARLTGEMDKQREFQGEQGERMRICREELRREMEQRDDAVLNKMVELQEQVHNDVATIKEAIVKLNIKSGIWDAIGGAIPIAVGILVYVLKGGVFG